MARTMTTLDGPLTVTPWGARMPSFPAVTEPLPTVPASETVGAAEASAAAVVPRSLPVLAPLLPLLLLVGVCVAGMTDPPAPVPGHAGPAVSRLHIPAPAEPLAGATSRVRHDLPGHGRSDAAR
jgi:hypothetical protein